MNRQGRDVGANAALFSAGEVWSELVEQFALGFFKRLGPDGALFEEIRVLVLMCGITEPPSPNAWGAVALRMAQRGLIERTGTYQQSQTHKSHARLQPKWRAR